jgi:hypothetical protein
MYILDDFFSNSSGHPDAEKSLLRMSKFVYTWREEWDRGLPNMSATLTLWPWSRGSAEKGRNNISSTLPWRRGGRGLPSGIVSACHQGDKSHGYWDRIPPSYTYLHRLVAYISSTSPWRRGLPSGIVSACHQGDWSYGSWYRIPPGYTYIHSRVVAFKRFKNHQHAH